MIIDIEKCENCNNCFLACKDEHYENSWPGYSLSQPLHGHRWMNILRKEQGEFPYISVAYLPKPCFHCDDPPCIRNASQKEISKRADGIVIIDPQQSKGRKDLVKTCPHGAIWWNHENQTPQKCTMCAHLLDKGWEAPRCVQACPTGALTFHSISREDVQNFIISNRLEAFQEAPVSDNVKSQHSVLYKNLNIYRTCFIAGSVATEINSLQECVQGATAELYQGGSLVSQAVTDAFGDYRFSGLPENSGTYEIKIIYGQNIASHMEIALGGSCFTGITWV